MQGKAYKKVNVALQAGEFHCFSLTLPTTSCQCHSSNLISILDLFCLVSFFIDQYFYSIYHLWSINEVGECSVCLIKFYTLVFTIMNRKLSLDQRAFLLNNRWEHCNYTDVIVQHSNNSFLELNLVWFQYVC